MSAGMAEVIAAHIPTITSSTFNRPESGNGRTCRCGAHFEVLHSEMDDSDSDAQPYLDRKLAAHVAEELAKAGHGSMEAAWDAGAEAAWARSTPVVNGASYQWRYEGEPHNPYQEAPHGVG